MIGAILMKMDLTFLKDLLSLQAFFKFLETNKLTENIEKLSSEINESNFTDYYTLSLYIQFV
jgi:hypothetical protein